MVDRKNRLPEPITVAEGLAAGEDRVSDNVSGFARRLAEAQGARDPRNTQTVGEFFGVIGKGLVAVARDSIRRKTASGQ